MDQVKYVTYISDYLPKKINTEEFVIRFDLLWNQTINKELVLEEKLQGKQSLTLLMNTEMKQFYQLAKSIFVNCEALTDENPIPKSKFKNHFFKNEKSYPGPFIF